MTNRLFLNMLLGNAGSEVPSDLRGFVRYHTKTNSTKFSDTNIDAFLNLYYHEFVNEILKSGSDIDFNMVTESINLVKDTPTISVAGKVLRIKKINVQWETGGQWYDVAFFDIGERTEPMDTTSITSDFTKTKPFADLYLSDETLKIDLYPIPSANMTNGLKVWKTLEITELSGTSDEPSIPEAYQKYLAWGAVRDYCFKKEMWKKRDEAKREMALILNRAIQFYNSRNENVSMVLQDGYSDNYGE